MKEKIIKAAPNEELLNTEDQMKELNQNDSQTETTDFEKELEERSILLDKREKDLDQRESDLDQREESVKIQENTIKEKSEGISAREKIVEKKEKEINSSKTVEEVEGLSFDFQGVKMKFKDSAPKIIRYDGDVMSQQAIIEDSDVLLDLVSSNSSLIEKL